MAQQIDGLSLGIGAAGGLLVFAGLKGYSVPSAIQALIQGHSPATAAKANTIASHMTGGTVPAGGPSGSLASDFLTYQGRVPYVWGGASPKGWDCSGSCNYVICHDLGYGIPGYKGGTFTGASHGPSTLTWLAWAPGHMQHLARGQAQSGDLVIWQTHMGVMVNATSYISAYDTQEGTVVKPVHGGGPIGEVASFWRLRHSSPALA